MPQPGGDRGRDGRDRLEGRIATCLAFIRATIAIGLAATSPTMAVVVGLIIFPTFSSQTRWSISYLILVTMNVAFYSARTR